MANVFCVRAEFGRYTDRFITGGYAGVGFIRDNDLTNIKTREELYPLYRQGHALETSNVVIGQQVGQIARFLLEIRAGDYVITPPNDTEWLHYGRMADDTSYFESSPRDGCPYQNRRKVEWATKRHRRNEFSVPFQNTMKSSLTVFQVSQRDEFLNVINRTDLVSRPVDQVYDAYQVVLEQILELDAAEFEVLISHLLTALGFEGSDAVGKSGDGGVDVIGELDVSNLAKIRLFVQAKRYRLGSKIKAKDVKKLRQSIPSDGQGAFITTAEYDQQAHNIALEKGFKRIGLINGNQLVDLLVEHWLDIPDEFRDKLGLKQGLVRS